MIAVSAASAEHHGMAKGAALATAFIALVALGRAQLPSRYEQAPTAPMLAGKIEKYVRLGGGEAGPLKTTASGTEWASLFSPKGTYNGYPFPSITGPGLEAEVKMILAGWESLDDPVGGPRWAVKPLNTPDGTALQEDTAKVARKLSLPRPHCNTRQLRLPHSPAPRQVIFEMTAKGTSGGGVTYAVPMTGVLYFDAQGKIEAAWDFYDPADFPPPPAASR